MRLCLRNQTKFKQNLNKIKATPCKTAEEINFVKGTSYKLAPAEAKFEMKKRRVETIRCVRKETENFGRGEVGFLMKKGCKQGGVSL